jgi:hypothetical protein
MSDTSDPGESQGFEIEPEEFEIAVGPEPDRKPEVVTLTPAEFAALKAQGDSAQAIQKGIEGLAGRMASPQPAAAPPVNTPVQSPEEFFAEHSDDLFDKEKGAKVLAEYNKKVIERDFGPMFSNISAQLAATKKELLLEKDPYFKKYEAEIEALVQAQPPNVRIQPNVYELAWRDIRAKHSKDIEDDSVNAQIDARVAERLKELGIDPAKPRQPEGRPAAYVNSEGRSAPSATPAGKRTVRLPDEATRIKLEKEALRRGLELSDLLKIKGYTA